MIAVRLGLVERAAPRMIAACAGLFAAPVILDLVLQRHFGVMNNGLAALYCVYSDPAHSWNDPCHTAFLAADAFGHDGAARGGRVPAVRRAASIGDRRRLGPRLHRLGGARHVPSLALVLCAVAALDCGAGALPRAAGFARAAVVVASLYAAVAIGWKHGPLCWLLLALGAATAMRSWRALLLLAGYLSGTLFLGAMGFAAYDRMQSTFSFMLPLGTAFLILGEPALPRAPGPREALVSPVVATAIAYLYLGWMLPSGWKDAYFAKVHGQRQGGAQGRRRPAPRPEPVLPALWQHRVRAPRRPSGGRGPRISLAGAARAQRMYSLDPPNAFLD